MSESQKVILPLSAAQHGIWSGQQFDLQSAVYNAGECIEIRGPVDEALFEAAVRQTVGEAEALHMRFVPGTDGPLQEASLSPDWVLHRIDLRGSPDPWAAALAWMEADLARPVDLREGPLFTQALFQASPERYVWFQRVHHVAMDGFGFSLLARRVAGLYTAKVAGRAAPEGFRRLRAVVEEDAAYRAGPQFALDRAFWMERLADRPTPVTLSRPEPLSPRFVRQTRHLDPQDMARLQEAARQEDLSWPDLVLAATAAWLHQRTAAPEVVLGLPVMSRLGTAALRVPCMAMNIVPLRVPVRPDQGLFELARSVAAELRAMRPHLRYRYEQLRRDLKQVGGQRRLFGPVVNIMPFDYGLRFAGMPGLAHNISAGPVEDLSIGVYARAEGGGPRVDFDANPACYGAQTLAAHQQDFLHVLTTLLAEPRRAVRELLPFSARTETGAEDMEKASASLLDGGALPVAPRAVLEQLLERAREQPDAVAVEQGPYHLSYRELLEAARSLGERLVAQGVQPDAPVAVRVPRGIDAIIASLGVLFAGAGYLPLDPFGPSAREAAILADAAPTLLVTTGRTPEPRAEPLPPGDLVVRRRETAARGTVSTPRPPEAECLAYVIYTSGSTGQPNGVQISRGALAHFVAGATARYGVRREDRVLQFAPLHFDASVEEIFLTLCAGARLVLRTEEMLQSVPRLLEACASAGITVLDLPTAFWHELAYSVSTGALALPACVRTVIIGGEAALPERVARWRACVSPEVQLFNTYGPTEATVVATVATLSGPPEGTGSEEVPIGRPLPGVRAVLLDPTGRLAAAGTEGELYLLGGGLARGYLGRAELDAARFTALSALPGRPRAYRTGDRARVREDGQLVFVGRVDDEFKISGHRIDPTEIETVLLGLPGVKDAAVVGQILAGGTRRLCAHVVVTDPAPTAAELRRQLLAVLPTPMVPGAFVFSDRLPRTSNGKVDRARLRREEAAPEATSSADMATDLEREILGIWEQVLGVGGLSPQDDFFELGGQSLQSIQVANRLSVTLGREVPVATVFRHPTAAALAQALEHGTDASTPVAGLSAAMLADAELEEEIVPRMHTRSPVSGAPPRQVLLTGATGFVGAHLLDQLLRQTDARVVCPVRARDEAHGMARLREALEGQGLATERLAGRVLALSADLSQPFLGLGATRFQGLAAECDAVYHNAAVVSVVREYASLKAVNVRGTRELLRLAAAVRPKPLHYVSTLAVAPPSNLRADVPEDFVPAHPGLRDGYQQSKWIAERLVQQAGERGLPVTLYRLGRVVGAPDRGIVNPRDLVWRILLSGIPAGALPRMDVHETWTPVDYVARALVRLSLLSRPVSVFNLAPHADVRLEDVFQWVREYGYRLDALPLPEWRARLAGGSASADRSATLAFFDLRAGAPEATFGLGTIRADHLNRTLEGSGITCPLADRALVHRYLNYCVEQGLLPRP